jgi:hypothetical protein
VTPTLTKFAAGVALLGVGGLAGAAMTAGSNLPPRTATVAAAPSPVEVRTVVVRRTVHVYRKPKAPRHRVIPAPTAAPVPVAPAPAPARVSAPIAPVRRAAPLQTRTSGSGGGEHERGDDEHESERGDD